MPNKRTSVRKKPRKAREVWLHRSTLANHGYLSLWEECNGMMSARVRCDYMEQMFQHRLFREVLPRKKARTK